MHKSQQVTSLNEIIMDFDQPIKSKKAILQLLENNIKQFDSVKITSEDKFFKIKYKKKEFKIYFKNLTYVGKSFSVHKKRIQLSLNQIEIKEYRFNKLNVIGIYHYEDNLIFILPKITNLYSSKWNESAFINVSTIDLFNASKDHNFKKIDQNNNVIYFFKQLTTLLDFIITNDFKYTNPLLEIIDKFATSKLVNNQLWYAKDCYQEIIKHKFKDKLQFSWIDFYFKYIFKDFLTSQQIIEKQIKYLNQQNTHAFFDLWISDSYFGDLKTHNINATPIFENDYATVKNAVNELGKLWLIVLFHHPVYDKDYDYEVTKFWKQLKNKLTTGLQQQKMANRTLLTELLVLEINLYNWQYIVFVNEDNTTYGNVLKKPQIMIKNKDFENFVIYRELITKV